MFCTRLRRDEWGRAVRTAEQVFFRERASTGCLPAGACHSWKVERGRVLLLQPNCCNKTAFSSITLYWLFISLCLSKMRWVRVRDNLSVFKGESGCCCVDLHESMLHQSAANWKHKVMKHIYQRVPFFNKTQSWSIQTIGLFLYTNVSVNCFLSWVWNFFFLNFYCYQSLSWVKVF